MSEGGNDNSISEATRRDVFDYLRVEQVKWAGRLEEAVFLSRLYRLGDIPSGEWRFGSIAEEIRQHRVRNPTDWEDDWVFEDSRFDLYACPDEEFLSFLCEMLHPIVRRDANEVGKLLGAFNDILATEGWQIIQEGEMGGRPVYGAQQLMPSASLALKSARESSDILNASYIARQVTRMQAAIQSDPELAIGTAKEFVETICKTILDSLGEPFSKGADLLDLVKQVRAELELLPESIDDKARGAATVKRILSNLGTAAQGLAELRGLYGTGHGKTAGSGGLQPRHARLAVGAATTLGVFLFETYQQRTGNGSSNG